MVPYRRNSRGRDVPYFVRLGGPMPTPVQLMTTIDPLDYGRIGFASEFQLGDVVLEVSSSGRFGFEGEVQWDIWLCGEF
jgi:hypothetical protein